MVIIWGRSKEIEFDGPIPLDKWEPPLKAGIYAIMIKPEPVNRPNTFRIIYFGESENLSERGFESHHKRNCWLREAGSSSNIFVGFHPNSIQEERRRIEETLINEYRPVCND